MPSTAQTTAEVRSASTRNRRYRGSCYGSRRRSIATCFNCSRSTHGCLLRGATIGRDAAADWSIADPNCEVSCNHCELGSDNGLSLHVSGANRVYDDFSGARYPDDANCSLPATLRLEFRRHRSCATLPAQIAPWFLLLRLAHRPTFPANGTNRQINRHCWNAGSFLSGRPTRCLAIVQRRP